MSDEQMQAISSELREWMRRLVQPLPYRVFCDRLREKFTPKQFESLIAELFRQMGYNVISGTAGPDEAIDLLVETAEGEIIVQCKKWKAKVGVSTVREVFGAARKRQDEGSEVQT